jgi:DNA-binding Lrp family transcriptional regulator
MSINIDETDRRILFELERNARIPDVKLAKIVRKSKDAVRYRIRKLEEAGIIESYKTWIDMAKIGYRTGTLYFTLLNIPDKKQQLIDEIKNDKRTYWIGVAEGVWNLGITYFVQSNDDLFDIKNDLLARYGDLIIDTHITSIVSVSVHEKNFLADQPSQLLTFTERIENCELDEVSKHVLHELYQDSRANIATIAARYRTTSDIVKGRIRKLEEQRIIIRYTIVIDYQKIGYEFYKAFVYLKNAKRQDVQHIMQYAEASKRVINIVKMLAPWDIELIIFAHNFNEYNETIGEFTKRFASTIKKVETAAMSEDIIFPCKKLIFE